MRATARQAGVTLVELLIALVVLAILLAIAVPSFRDFFEKARLRGAADELVSFFGTQRQAAVRFDRQVHASIRGTTDVWCAGARMAPNPVVGQQVPPAGTCDCSATPAECVVDGVVTVVTAADFGGAAARPTIDAADISLTFDGQRGTLANFANAGNVVLNSSSGRWQLRVDVLPLGQARACVPAGSASMGGFNPC